MIVPGRRLGCIGAGQCWWAWPSPDRRHDPAPEAVWATPTQAIQVALNAARLAGPDASLLILAARGWSGTGGLGRTDRRVAEP